MLLTRFVFYSVKNHVRRVPILGAVILVIAFIAASSMYSPTALAVSEVEQLRAQISERNSRLAEIDAEIKQYQAELTKVGSEKKSLQSAIARLELERKKVQADISYTQNKIGTTDLEISKLNIEIYDTEESIAVNEDAIGEVLRRVNESDETTIIESLLRHDNLSEFWVSIEELESFRARMGDEVKSLVSQKILLEEKRTESNKKRDELIDLKEQYVDQNRVLTNNKAEKDDLLRVTKNEETKYQNLLAEKRSIREQLEKELRDFESQLQFILDPSSIPTPGTVVFDWPLTSITITQLFGGTEFAKQNASVYGGRPYHSGVDFGAPRGTKIYAPLSGTVRATGNTDAVPGCYSWGKWTLIDHANGLATLYAHQDVISVTAGQKVSTGDIIGYTGNTGYSTGPHLHFTVYAKAGVSVRKFNEIKTVTSCGPASTPVAATDAYLDPMLYLPNP